MRLTRSGSDVALQILFACAPTAAQLKLPLLQLSRWMLDCKPIG